MTELTHHMSLYREVAGGAAPAAYRALMQFFRDLRLHLDREHPQLAAGAVHAGEMDATYIPLAPETLKSRKLKALLIFFHDSFRFEVWLSGVNKGSQAQWWTRFREGGFDAYTFAEHPTEDFQFVRELLVEEPDFADVGVLQRELGERALAFVREIEAFLSSLDEPRP